MTDKQIVGVDVSKDWLDIAWYGRARVERLRNDAKAMGAWLDGLGAAPLLAFEPTGGYERCLQDQLQARGIAFARLHPNDVIAFRKSRGIKAKTDRIDARLIATFAAEELPRRRRRAPPLSNHHLSALAARRRQLTAMLHAERCRQALAQEGCVAESLDAIIRALKHSLEQVSAEIDAAIAANAELADRAALMQSLKGVGPITAATLIADLPELGHLTGKQIASLAGLAPITRQSGKKPGRARIARGRPGVRRVLFNAARCAIVHNPPLRVFYQRLVTENRRPGKVALTAVMRKMLVILNAIAKQNAPWKHAIA